MCRSDDPVLDVRELTVRYGSRLAVDQVGLRVQRGEIVGLLGPNGAGKTSTLSAIEGLLAPAHGDIAIDGIDMARDPIEAKARLGVQLQASSFQPELSIEQIARLYAGLYGVRLSRVDIAERIRQIGLGAELGKPCKKLSGGQRQRLALFIAVLHSPSLLLLDEPTAGLDPQSRRQLWQRIEALRADSTGILLTTHSMEEAESVCDRIAIIDHGQIITIDTPQAIIDDNRDKPEVIRASRKGRITLEDVFIGLTGTAIRS
jgi:ABC-2 type transport system ATP-binding protein